MSHANPALTPRHRLKVAQLVDIATLGPPQPALPNRPRLALLNTQTGKINDR